MNTEMQLFQNPAFGEIRVTIIEGEPWFVAVDVCKALEIKNPTVAVSTLDDDERAKFNLGRQGETNIVNEPGLYGLVLGSRKPEAKAFKRWIKHDVLPSIRKHGAYMTPPTIDQIISGPDFGIRLLQELKTEREERQRLESDNAALTAEVAAFEPVRKYVDQILSSTGTMTTTQIAADYGLSAQKLNKILHEEKIQHKVNGQWILYKSYMGNGYTQSVTIPITRANGKPDAKLHTQWTQKGRLMIHDILTGRGITAKADRMAS